jgi:hypothetical protein
VKVANSARKEEIKMSRKQMTVARTGVSSQVVLWAVAGVVAVAAGAYFVAQETGDGGPTGATVSREAAPSVLPQEDAILRFSDPSLRDQDAILRTSSVAVGDAREQDAILRLSAA